MTKDVQKLLEKAMAMRAGDRAMVAQELLRSLERPADPDVDAAWQAEAARRMKQLDQGEVRPVTWESVRDRLR